MTLHRVVLGIVQSQANVVEADDSPNPTPHTREQAFQVTAAGDRTRERDNRLIDLRLCLHSRDHHFFVSCFDGNTIPKRLLNGFRHLRASADFVDKCRSHLPNDEVICRMADTTTRPAAH